MLVFFELAVHIVVGKRAAIAPHGAFFKHNAVFDFGGAQLLVYALPGIAVGEPYF